MVFFDQQYLIGRLNKYVGVNDADCVKIQLYIKKFRIYDTCN